MESQRSLQMKSMLSIVNSLSGEEKSAFVKDFVSGAGFQLINNEDDPYYKQAFPDGSIYAKFKIFLYWISPLYARTFKSITKDFVIQNFKLYLYIHDKTVCGYPETNQFKITADQKSPNQYNSLDNYRVKADDFWKSLLEKDFLPETLLLVSNRCTINKTTMTFEDLTKLLYNKAINVPLALRLLGYLSNDVDVMDFKDPYALLDRYILDREIEEKLFAGCSLAEVQEKLIAVKQDKSKILEIITPIRKSTKEVLPGLRFVFIDVSKAFVKG